MTYFSALLLMSPGLVHADTCRRGDCANGVGAFLWSDGDRYSGEFSGGSPSGLGVYRVPGQQRYAGEWAHGKREGAGVIVFDDGRNYRGEFDAGGKMHGLGVQSWTGEHRVARGYDEVAEPGQFEGAFKNGVWWGRGRITRGVKHPDTGESVTLSDEGLYEKGKLINAESVDDAVAAAKAAAAHAEEVAKAARAKAREANMLPLHKADL